MEPIFSHKYAQLERGDVGFVVFHPARRGFLLFRGASVRQSVAQFVAHCAKCTPEERDFQEVIDGTRAIKLAFDLDFNEPQPRARTFDVACAWFRETIVSEVVDVARDIYFDLFDDVITRDDFAICESIDAREPDRLSAHITILRSVPSFQFAKLFAEKVIDAVSAEARDIIDLSLYMRQHNLRLLGCYKEGSVREKKLERADHHDIYDTIVSIPAQMITRDAIERVEPLLECAQHAACSRDECSHDISADMIAHANELIIAEYGEGVHRVRRVLRSLVIFERLLPSECHICERQHEHDNTLIVRITKDQSGTRYTEVCRRSHGNARLLDEVLCDDNIARACEVAREVARDPARDPEIREDCAESREIYDEPTMRAYPMDARTLYVRAPMKIGKTKALREYTRAVLDNEESRAIFISFRRAFSDSIIRQFDDFEMYRDLRGDLVEKRMVVQVESLHRIIPEKIGHVDLVILDESESIIEQFDSGLSKSHMLDFAVFQWLVRTSGRVIAMDAHLDERTMRVIGRMRGAEGARFIENTHQNARDWSYYFSTNRNIWLCAILECLREGSRIVVCANSAAEGAVLREIIRRKLADAQVDREIRFYCAETPARIKAEDFADINASWSDCDVLIYTPTITAGLSFELIHFDYLFGYFTDQSCCAQTCIQMMGRIRNIRTCSAYICIVANDGSFPESREDMIMWLRMRKAAILREDDPLSGLGIEFTDAGLQTIRDTDYAEIRIQNAIVRNKSRNNFACELMTRIARSGAQCIQFDKAQFAQCFRRNLERREIVDADVLHRDVSGDNRDQYEQLVSGAVELEADEYDNLRAKARAKVCDISEEEYAQLKKYELRTIYRREDRAFPISAYFVHVFDDPQMMSAFVNIARLYDAIREGGANRSVTEALVMMRETEKAQVIARGIVENDEELNYPFVYDAHRLANVVARIMGFRDVLDRRARSETDVMASILGASDHIRSIWRGLCAQFKLPRRFGTQMLRAEDLIDHFSNVLRMMYMIHLVKIGTVFRLQLTSKFIIYDDGIAPSPL